MFRIDNSEFRYVSHFMLIIPGGCNHSHLVQPTSWLKNQWDKETLNDVVMRAALRISTCCLLRLCGLLFFMLLQSRSFLPFFLTFWYLYFISCSNFACRPSNTNYVIFPVAAQCLRLSTWINKYKNVLFTLR